MIKVTYTADGSVIGDDHLEDWAKKIVIKHNNLGNLDLRVGCGIMIQMLRVLIVRGTINYKDIVFYTTDGIYVGPDSNGRLEWPKGFADKNDYLLDELLNLL